MSASRIWALCQRCAGAVYATVAPSPRYADETARLLFGTCMQESHGIWERQRTPSWDGYVGGFSKWQVEQGSVADSLHLLRRRPELAARATQFLFADPRASTTWVELVDPLELLRWLRIDDNDVPGVLMARLHYLRVPDPIPSGVQAQSAYWKKHFNTVAGKGTVNEYLHNWARYCAPVVGS